MSIPQHPTPPPAFNVENLFPQPPTFKFPEDNAAFQQFWTDFLKVLTRQFTAVTTAIDTKQDKS